MILWLKVWSKYLIPFLLVAGAYYLWPYFTSNDDASIARISMVITAIGVLWMIVYAIPSTPYVRIIEPVLCGEAHHSYFTDPTRMKAKCEITYQLRIGIENKMHWFSITPKVNLIIPNNFAFAQTSRHVGFMQTFLYPPNDPDTKHSFFLPIFVNCKPLMSFRSDLFGIVNKIELIQERPTHYWMDANIPLIPARTIRYFWIRIKLPMSYSEDNLIKLSLSVPFFQRDRNINKQFIVQPDATIRKPKRHYWVKKL